MALLDRFERFLDQVIPAPEEAVELTRRGELMLRADDPDGALRLAERARAIAPGYLRALSLACDALALLARPFDALAALDEAAKERALPVELLARMAELAAAHGPPSRVAELDAHVRGRLRGTDAAIAARMLRGAESLARWDPSLALRYARTATLADPSLARAWATLGDDAAARGDLPRARAMLARAAAALNAADARGNAQVGALALALGEREAAERCLRRAWVAGDDADAFARLVGLLAGTGEVAALSRLIVGAGAAVSAVARALLAAEKGEDVAPLLEPVDVADVPEALWSLALRTALRGAPEVASRWVAARPDAPHAPAVAALASVRRDAEGPLEPVAAAAAVALADAAVGSLADPALRAALRSRWEAALPRCLDELPRMLAGVPVALPCVEAISLRRKEIDEVLRVAVLGEFSAGKSTFVNALVGMEVSPMGVLPTTAAVHLLRFGDPLARVFDARGAVTECAVSDAASVLRRRRQGDVAVDRVEVTLPLTRLASMELIDTPGFNAGDDDHERAGRAAMALADVALWLFDARQAGKDSERGPLGDARGMGLTPLGVLNKCDHLDDAGRAEVLRTLDLALGALAPCVAAVSARAALTAMADRREDPGWTSFERWLGRELVERRDEWKRARVARRAEADIAAALAALDAAEASRRDVAAARAALGAELDGMRESLRDVAAAARTELALVLSDQSRAPRGAAPDDVAALLDDTAAESLWRATRAAMSALRPRLDLLESLAVRAGVVDAGAAELVSAPVAVWLELAVRDAARDAADGRGELSRAPGRWLSRALPAVDPLATLRAHLDRAHDAHDVAARLARLALEVAAGVCARCEAPRPPRAEMLDAMIAPTG